MKCRWQKGETVAGITILQVVKRGSHYSKSEYKVQFSCGHIDVIAGNAMNSRQRRIADGVESSLCTVCSLKEKAEAKKDSIRAGRLTPPKRYNSPHHRRVDKMLSMICEHDA